MSLRQSFSYNVAIGLASTLGARVVPTGITRMRLATTADCYVVIAPTPTATVAAGMLIKQVAEGECFEVYPGDQIAVISGTAGGTLNVTELTR